MTIDQQIEFYQREYKAAKSRDLALVAFGAYMALVQLKASLCFTAPFGSAGR